MEEKDKKVKQRLCSLAMERFGSLTQEIDVNMTLSCILTCPRRNLIAGTDLRCVCHVNHCWNFKTDRLM